MLGVEVSLAGHTIDQCHTTALGLEVAGCLVQVDVPLALVQTRTAALSPASLAFQFRFEASLYPKRPDRDQGEHASWRFLVCQREFRLLVTWTCHKSLVPSGHTARVLSSRTLHIDR